MKRIPKALQRRVVALERSDKDDSIPPTMWAPSFLPVDEWEALAVPAQAALKQCAGDDTSSPQYSSDYQQWQNVLFPVAFGNNKKLEELALKGIERSPRT